MTYLDRIWCQTSGWFLRSWCCEHKSLGAMQKSEPHTLHHEAVRQPLQPHAFHTVFYTNPTRILYKRLRCVRKPRGHHHAMAAHLGPEHKNKKYLGTHSLDRSDSSMTPCGAVFQHPTNERLLCGRPSCQEAAHGHCASCQKIPYCSRFCQLEDTARHRPGRVCVEMMMTGMLVLGP